MDGLDSSDICKLLKEPLTFQAFEQFCKSKFCEENLYFWQAVEDYKRKLKTSNDEVLKLLNLFTLFTNGTGTCFESPKYLHFISRRWCFGALFFTSFMHRKNLVYFGLLPKVLSQQSIVSFTHFIPNQRKKIFNLNPTRIRLSDSGSCIPHSIADKAKLSQALPALFDEAHSHIQKLLLQTFEVRLSTPNDHFQFL